VEVEGIKFLYDENQAPYFSKAKVDYTKNLFGTGEFKVLQV
jgi:Fe-S cluster assembly iron-binding protein IscA